MGRYSSSNSYGFSYRKMGEGCYRINWTVDFYCSGSRGRFPRQFMRDTDLAGVKRFCKKHDLKFEEE